MTELLSGRKGEETGFSSALEGEPNFEIKQEQEKQLADSAEIRKKFQEKLDLMGAPYANHNEKAFSGDGASLFTLVDFNGKPELVKLGWGEFSADTFTKGAKSKYSDYAPVYKNGPSDYYIKQHKMMRNLPFDVFCVSQRNSYFADGDTQREMLFDPIEYLQKNTLFAVNNGKVTVAEKSIEEDSGLKPIEYNISPIPEAKIVEMIENL